MPDHLAVFMLAALLFTAMPGPDVLYITARGIEQGRRAGLVSAASAALGATTLTLAAALGLSAVLESSALAFAVVKYLGAAYLIYLGLHRLLKRSDAATPADQVSQTPLRRVFAQGFVVAVLNPKTALFFVAFLPQFVNPYQGSIKLQLIILGLILVGIGLLTDTCYALVSGTFGNWLLQRRGLARRGRFAAGATYLALGVAAAVTRPVRTG